MKKRIMLLVMSVMMSAFILSSCGQENSDSQSEIETEEEADDEADRNGSSDEEVSEGDLLCGYWTNGANTEFVVITANDDNKYDFSYGNVVNMYVEGVARISDDTISVKVRSENGDSDTVKFHYELTDGILSFATEESYESGDPLVFEFYGISEQEYQSLINADQTPAIDTPADDNIPDSADTEETILYHFPDEYGDYTVSEYNKGNIDDFRKNFVVTWNGNVLNLLNLDDDTDNIVGSHGTFNRDEITFDFNGITEKNSIEAFYSRCVELFGDPSRMSYHESYWEAVWVFETSVHNEGYSDPVVVFTISSSPSSEHRPYISYSLDLTY